MARKIMEQLMAKGKISRGYLGILPQDIDNDLAKAFKLSTTRGALVGDVTADGPADKGGMKRGDIITRFNGTEVSNSLDLRNLVAESSPGSTANISLLLRRHPGALNCEDGYRGPCSVHKSRDTRLSTVHG